ncbi:MAG: hypothetical protein JO317_06130, partial [Verrucomicrobiae bacterium]|nr:hypothetical protein [Verrucomicrobiae bacterium]
MSADSNHALVLAGHGSHYNADSSEPARALAEELRRRGLFAEVRTAFWKEQPGLCEILDTLASPEVHVVPFFISAGYFTEQVVPREMKLKPGWNEVGGRRVHYARPVGTHSEMTKVLLHRAETALGGAVAESSVSLFIVGHGTTENENSAQAVHAQVDAISKLGRFAEVKPAFMEQEPTHHSILRSAASDRVLIIPFFISDGLHSREDIPADIGFAKRGAKWTNPVEFSGKTLWYTPAIGSDSRMAEVVLSRVAEGEPGKKVEGGRSKVESRNGVLPLRFGELTIQRRGEGVEIRHVEDAAAADLIVRNEPFAANGLSRLDPAGKYRPLRTARSLPRGWKLKLSEAEAAEALEHFYPAVRSQMERQARGELRVVSYSETAGRQTGLYTVTAELKPDEVETAIR